MEGKNCTFEHEASQGDCLLCIPNAILTHVNVLLSSICSMNIEFGHARNIYVAFDEIKKMQKGLVKLMKEACPEAIERAKLPKDDGGIDVA